MISYTHKIKLGIILFSFLIPSFVSAEATDELLDPRCFTKNECINARKEQGMSSGDLGSGFYNNTAETRTICKHRSDAQDVELGFCLPAGQAVTAVKFGTENKFANIGEFMSYMYRYGIIFAAILAVLMIIVAGFQWTASGGNSSTIESAKKRIAGSVTGLILVLTSYTILNAINPSTVNLRLPQVWLIRAEKTKVEHKYCMELPLKIETTGATVPKVGKYEAADQASGNYTKANTNLDAYKLKPFSSGDPSLARINAIFPAKEETANTPCGQKMVIADSEGSTCLGTYCANDSICWEDKRCIPFIKPPGGGISGSIAYTEGKYLDRIELHIVCLNEDGTWRETFLQNYKTGEASKFYQMQNVPAQGTTECGGTEKVMGYFFVIEANDSDVSVTSDDTWFGGKSFCANQTGQDSCGFYGANTLDEDSINPTNLFGLAGVHELFTQDDMTQSIRCDFRNSEKSMPNLDNGISTYLAAYGISKTAANFVSETAANKIGGSILTEDSERIKENFCPHLKSKQDNYTAAIQARMRQVRRP